jgi:hypothetical protein
MAKHRHDDLGVWTGFGQDLDDVGGGTRGRVDVVVRLCGLQGVVIS